MCACTQVWQECAGLRGLQGPQLLRNSGCSRRCLYVAGFCGGWPCLHTESVRAERAVCVDPGVHLSTAGAGLMCL